MRKRFAIYASESPRYQFRRPGGEIELYHAYLSLIDETDCPLEQDGTTRPGDELHFIHDLKTERLAPITRKQASHVYDGHILLRGGVGGYEEEVLPVWTRMLEAAMAVRDLKLEFSMARCSGAFNCRAGMHAVMEAAMLPPEPPADIKMKRGSDAKIYRMIEDRLPPQRCGQSLEDLRARNEELMMAMSRT